MTKTIPLFDVLTTVEPLKLAFELEIYPPPCIKTQTGSFEVGVAVLGAHTLTKRQSSDWEDVGPLFVARQIGPNYRIILVNIKYDHVSYDVPIERFEHRLSFEVVEECETLNHLREEMHIAFQGIV